MSADFGQSILASSISLAVLLLIMAAVYLIWSRIGLKRKQKYFEELHVELAPGQEIMFAGGIYGTVKSVNGDKVEVKVRSGAVIDVSRYAIQQISK